MSTHLYPGARLAYSQMGEPEFEPGDVLEITFSDTMRTTAKVIGATEDIARIGVAGYRTRRGAVIVSKNWFIRKAGMTQGSAWYSVIGRAY